MSTNAMMDRLFAGLIKEEDKSGVESFQPGRLELPLVNVLVQPRRTFEGIEELAQDIANTGVIHPPTVACLTVERAEAHVAAVNELYGTQHRASDLAFVDVPHGRVCYILLAGERRSRAHKHLWSVGCAKCLEKHGPETPGKCFRRHIKDGKLEVRLCLGINVVRALFLQLSENTHVAVPAHEEADAYAKLFRLLRRYDPNYSVKAFSLKVGRSEDTIRRALKYVDLPASVRALVERSDGPRLPYGAALELVRLRDALAEAKEGSRVLDEQDLLIEARMFFARGQSLKAFQDYVKERIRNASSGQLGLFGEVDPAQKRGEQCKSLRRAVSSANDRFLTASIGYATIARSVLERGDPATFTLRGPVRQLYRMSRELLLAMSVHERSGPVLSIAAVIEHDDQAVKLARELQRLFLLLRAELPTGHCLEIEALLASARYLLELDDPSTEAVLSR